MTGTERKVFELILTKKKVSIFEIAKKMGISTDYASLICQGLKRHNDIDISGNYCSISKPPVLSSRNLNKSNFDSPQPSVERLDQIGHETETTQPPKNLGAAPPAGGEIVPSEARPIWKEEKRITQKISKKNEASLPQGAGLPLEKEAGKKRKKQKMDSFSNLKTVNKETAKILRKAGYENIKDIIRTPFTIFMQKTGIELSRAAKIFNEAKKKIGII